MTEQQEAAMRQALEALKESHPEAYRHVITALTAALTEESSGTEQPAQQEPVAWLVYAKGTRKYFVLTFDVEKVPEIYIGGEAFPLYTRPQAPEPVIDKSAAIRIATALGWEPKRDWVGLTDEDKHHVWVTSMNLDEAIEKTEAKLREKNT